jgi:hypothetical protein
LSPNLILRRPRISLGSWPDHDFDVFDGELEIGRIYRVTDQRGSPWFWGVSFQVIGRKSYGYADSLEEAKAAFKVEYESWITEQTKA